MHCIYLSRLFSLFKFKFKLKDSLGHWHYQRLQARKATFTLLWLRRPIPGCSLPPPWMPYTSCLGSKPHPLQPPPYGALITLTGLRLLPHRAATLWEYPLCQVWTLPLTLDQCRILAPTPRYLLCSTLHNGLRTELFRKERGGAMVCF